VIFVSIGNNEGARPQSGLCEASLVFEAPAEGGITRTLAGFTHEVDKIGPVRSARKHLTQIAIGYDAPFAHCGGSEDSYEIIRNVETKSMDEIYTARECFWRSHDRVAPNNLYTSTEKLVEGAKKRGFDLPALSLFHQGAFSGEPAQIIEYNFSKLEKYPNKIRYEYKDSLYWRSINGKLHQDDAGNPVTPTNLVFMEVETKYPTGKPIEVDMNLRGEGKALYFSRGVMREGMWKKTSLKEPLQFFIGEDVVPFAEGMTWVHLVPDLSQVQVVTKNTN